MPESFFYTKRGAPIQNCLVIPMPERIRKFAYEAIEFTEHNTDWEMIEMFNDVGTGDLTYEQMFNPDAEEPRRGWDADVSAPVREFATALGNRLYHAVGWEQLGETPSQAFGGGNLRKRTRQRAACLQRLRHAVYGGARGDC